YRILGSLSFVDPNRNWGYDKGIINDAVKEAKHKGGDAIVIRQGAEYGVSQIADAKINPRVISSHQTTALVLKWLTPQEISDRKLLLDEFLKRFSENDSRLAPNRAVAQLVMIYLFQQGYDPKSAELWDRFHETVTKLVSQTPESLAGSWIFKATVSLS